MWVSDVHKVSEALLVHDRGPVLLLLHLQGDADGCPDDGDGEPDVALDV